jgi:hypothetical protein
MPVEFIEKKMDFSADIVKLPNGKHALREYAEHPSAVAVIAFTGRKDARFKNRQDLLAGRILLVKQRKIRDSKTIIGLLYLYFLTG